MALQEVPVGEYVTGMDDDGTFISKRVGIEEISYVGVFGIESTSTTTATIGYGNTNFAFDTIEGLKINYTVEGLAIDEPGQYIYGIIRAIDTTTNQVTVLITVAPGAAGAGIYSNWRFQVVAGPSFGVVASATGGFTTTSMAVPSLGAVVTFTTDAGKMFDVGSTLLLSSIADSTGAPADATNYFEIEVRTYDSVTGVTYGIVNKVGGSGTFSAWLVQRTSPVSYRQGKVGLDVTQGSLSSFSVTAGSVLDSTGRVPIYNTSTLTKKAGVLWAAGSGSTVGSLRQLAGTVAGSAVSINLTGTGTSFVTDLAAVGWLAFSTLIDIETTGATNDVSGVINATSLDSSTVFPPAFSGKTYAFKPWTCRTTLFIVRKDSDGTTELVEQVGSSQTLGWLPTGYTYYKAIAVFTWTKGSFVSVLPIPSIPVFGAAGANHNEGLVPDPGSATATVRVLKEDATWADVGATATPIVAGTGAVGTSNLYARQDHVHPRQASWLLVDSGSLPAAATKTVAIPADYSDLQITFTGVSSNTATREFQIRFSTDGGATYDSTASNYPSIALVNAGAVGVSSRATAFQLGTMAAADTADGVIVVSGYSGLFPKLVQGHGVSATVSRAVLGRYLTSLRITHIQFGWDASGNFDAGTYTVSVK